VKLLITILISLPSSLSRCVFLSIKQTKHVISHIYQSMGMTSIDSGVIEFMIHRRTFGIDYEGPWPLNDTTAIQVIWILDELWAIANSNVKLPLWIYVGQVEDSETIRNRLSLSLEFPITQAYGYKKVGSTLSFALRLTSPSTGFVQLYRFLFAIAKWSTSKHPLVVTVFAI